MGLFIKVLAKSYRDKLREIVINQYDLREAIDAIRVNAFKNTEPWVRIFSEELNRSQVNEIQIKAEIEDIIFKLLHYMGLDTNKLNANHIFKNPNHMLKNKKLFILWFQTIGEIYDAIQITHSIDNYDSINKKILYSLTDDQFFEFFETGKLPDESKENDFDELEKTK